MLSEEEQVKLATFMTKLTELKDFDAQMLYWMTAQQFQWLAEKLIETNDELAKVYGELQKTNEELARVWEVYGP